MTKRTESDKILRDEASKIARNPKYDVYERGLVSMVNKSFDKRSKISCIKSLNIHIFFEMILWDHDYDDNPILKNYLSGAVKLVTNADTDKYKYSGYGIGFDKHVTFSVSNEFNRNVTIFEADMSSSVHVENKKQDIPILGKGPTQGLGDTTLTSEKSIQLISLRLEANFL